VRLERTAQKGTARAARAFFEAVSKISCQLLAVSQKERRGKNRLAKSG
jgi:hypothetical protein